MLNKTLGKRLCLVFLTMTPFAALGQAPGYGQLARFQEKVRQDMTSIPNYTCLETIERTHREPHGRSFKSVDTIRLEVSMVAGKELFAWPGARRFDDQSVRSLVTSGAIGTGMFAMFTHNLFVNGKGTREYHGEENLNGRTCIRYDFHLTPQESGLRLTTGSASEIVAAKGSFWFDPASLDLIRLEVFGEDVPYSLRIEEAVFRTDYARTHIGDADALLPKRSEHTMAHFDGEASHNAIEFSGCHEYLTQSTISFDAPSALPEAPKPQVREVELPAGLEVPIEMDTVIDSKTALVGDTLHARVVQEVRYHGEVLVPRGAAVTGHVRKLDHTSAPARFAVGIEFSEVEWEGARASFYGELVDLDRKSAGAHRPATYFDGHTDKVVIDRDIPGAGIFYMDRTRFRIGPGLRMVWRTLARPGGAAQPPG
jgi:hypothetical protein